MRPYIPKAELKVGARYRCDARNFEVGRWNGEAFEYERHKFGTVFQDVEYHYEDGAPYGTAMPLEEVTDE